MRIKISMTRADIDPAAIQAVCTKAEMLLAQQIAKDTRPFVPALTSVFDRSTKVIGNKIVYTGDQVNYLWEGVRMVNAATGKGPRYIPDVGYRWPKGAQLRPTTTPLKYSTEMHPRAQSHWMDASERENGRKWAEYAERLIANGFDKY